MMEQVLARFFWGSCNTSSKTHWIKWKDECRPTSEGGLGIRCLADTVTAYSYKLWWRFRERNSLWAEYMQRKYWSISSTAYISRSNRFSPTWRRMFKAGRTCQNFIRWILGNGKVSLWDDIWVKDQPLANLCLREGVPEFARVEDLWTDEDTGWDDEAIYGLLDEWGIPREVAEEILLIPVDTNGEDIARWSLTPHGNFTVASAWELIRHRGEKMEVYNIIWDKGINPTISVFLWRLLANRIPVEVKVQWRGVSLASKCRCCKKSDTETRLHLFVNGEAATEVWNHFARWFPQVPDFSWPGRNLEARLRWWQRHMGGRNKHHICTLIPCLIFWYIWTERNECVHREKTFKVENICRRIVVHLRNLVLAGHLRPEHWGGCEPRVDFMGAKQGRKDIREVEKIQWRPPEWPWVKLNVDGAFEGSAGRAGGGGLVRNYQGEVLEAFCTPLVAETCFEAEVKALLKGILVAKHHGNHIWLETDAETLSSLLERGQLGPAETRHILTRVRLELKDLTWKITSIRREGNKAADHLALIGKNSPTELRFSASSAPARVRALARLDQMGMPNFRFR